uniref:von Willebrand factor A domain containing 8 n=1 Tax=Salmo trutta TaxID=8032 RepID=A0A673VXU8_SALTR
MHSQILCKGTAAAVAARRMRNILGPVLGKGGWTWNTHEVKLLNTSAGDTVKIGEISYQLKTPRNPELVPINHMSETLPQTVVQHLRWIMQKDLLGQDVFLIGPPGPLRRSIAMKYLELTKREVEYVALSRDTTETDLKQRREIRSGTAFYIDQVIVLQCAVRAATEGRILVLEGLEKAERNVLPVLNNLLENREMQLEDGRFLMSYQRYDKLLTEHTKEELDAWQIVRVSEYFRVIALGLPVPRYKGNPLDPPLRSRFQARDIYYLPFKDQLEILYVVGPNVPAERVSQLLSFATTLCSQESHNLGLPDFPVDNLPPALTVLEQFPMLSSQQLVQRLYPYQAMLGKEGRTAVEGVLSRFELLDACQQPASSAVLKVVPASTEQPGQAGAQADVTVRITDKDITFQVPAGTKAPRPPNSNPAFISTPSHAQLLAEMVQSHLVKDMCLIGAKGCGKSAVAKEFAEMLGYNMEPVMLYQDMTARDLLQQRYTLANGDTAWRPSPLVTAAQEGKLLLLDGIHRVNLGTLAVLSRLLHDRELSLYDGSRLLRWDRYQEHIFRGMYMCRAVKAVKMGHILVIDEADKAPTNVTCILKTLVESGEMILADGRRIVSDPLEAERRPNTIAMHPDFRMLVLANRPGFPFLGNDFFGSLGDIFSCHAVDNPKPQAEFAMLKQYGPAVPDATLHKLVAAFGELRAMADQGTITYPYSTREVVNIVKHLQRFPDEGLANVVRNVFDFDSYNKDTREVLIEALHKHGIPIGAKPSSVHLAKELPLPEVRMSGYWTTNQEGNARRKLLCPTETHPIDIKGPVFLRVQGYPCERQESRALSFTEEKATWQIPMSEVNIICDVTTNNDAIYMATCNPVCLFAMKESGDTVQCMELYDVFPRTISGVWQPFVTVAALGSPLEGQVVLHEEQSNTVLHLDVLTGAVRRLILSQEPEQPAPKASNWWSSSSSKEAQGGHKMCREFAYKNWLLFFKEGGNQLDVLDVLEGRVHTISLPINLSKVFLVAEDRWLLVESNTNKKFLLTKPMHMGAEDSGVCQLHSVSEDGVSTGHGANAMCVPQTVGSDQLPNENLSAALGQKIVSPNRLLSDTSSYARIIVGFPDLMSPNEVYSFKRDVDLSEMRGGDSGGQMFSRGGLKSGVAKRTNCVSLLSANQVVRALPPGQAPLKDIFPPDVTPPMTAAYLEVTDLNSKKLKYIPVPRSLSVSPYTTWISKVSDSDVLLAGLGSGGVVTVDMGGYVRLWETGLENLQRSLLEWRTMIGSEDGRPIQITVQRDSGLDVTAPKHGKVDPENAPHVGGNQWAGGTGGRDTAGLGGKGGPYRLDAGHKVHQLSKAEINAIPEDVRRAAREMGEKAFKARLKEIDMSEYDASTYERFSGNVRRQVQSLRIILDSLQAKGKERQWLKNQSLGELDDAKIIDGLTGEKAIYKRRGELDPELGSPQQKPKRLRVLADVSGSMYRFNGVDGRLERSMEAVCMVMEALESYEQKIKYDIVGHSGDGYDIELVRTDKVPKNNKQRLKVLKNMHAHSQFCMSGDYTLESTEAGIRELAREDADERFVVVLSDANLERYGITPERFARALTSDPQVNAFAIFIGSLGDQADRLQRTLPAGRSFVAMDTKHIPQILQQIFTSTMLSSA